MTPAAYEFTIKNNNQGVGMMIVSGRKDWMPVLEFSGSKAPSSDLSLARSTAINKGFIDPNDQSEPTFYYGGALSYAVQFGDKMKNQRLVIALMGGSIEQLAQDTKPLKMDPEQSRSAWAKVIQTINNQPQPNTSGN